MSRAPVTRDGSPVIHPLTLESGEWHYWHGEADDLVADPQEVGGGTPFEATLTAAGDTVIEWSYRDMVWIAGGTLTFQGAQLGDTASFCIYAPATAVVANGGGTGNCNVSGAVIVPAAGDGAYDVDLSAAAPVPTADSAPYTGYWDFTPPADMKGPGTITAGAPGTAKYHLLTVDQPLDQFAKGIRLLGSGKELFEPQNINVSACLPKWKFKMTLHNEDGGHTVEVVWRMLVSRFWTTG